MKAAGVERWNVFLPVCRGNSWPQTSSTNPIKLEQKIPPAMKKKPFSLRGRIFPPSNPLGLGGIPSVSQLCTRGDGDSGAEPSREGKGRTGGGKRDVGKVTSTRDWDSLVPAAALEPCYPSKAIPDIRGMG